MTTPGTETTDPFLDCQEQAAAWIKARPWFAGIPVVTADQGNVLEAITANLSKLGLCIIVEPSEPAFSYAGTRINVDLPIVLTVWENVLFNRGSTGTRKRASAVAMELVRAFRPQTPAAPCVVTEAQLRRDSGGECVYTVTARRRFTE